MLKKLSIIAMMAIIVGMVAMPNAQAAEHDIMEEDNTLFGVVEILTEQVNGIFVSLDTLKQKTVDLAERNERVEERLLMLEERILELEYMAEKFANSSNRGDVKILPYPEPVFNCVTEPCILPEPEHSDITTQYLASNSEVADPNAEKAQEKRADALEKAEEKRAEMSEEQLEKKTAQAADKADKEMPVKSKAWWKFW